MLSILSSYMEISATLYLFKELYSLANSLFYLYFYYFILTFFSLSSFLFSSSFLHSSDPLHYPKPSNNHHSTKLQIPNPTSKINHSKSTKIKIKINHSGDPLHHPKPKNHHQAEIGKASSNPFFRSIPI
jgi:hypothetical protein